jgi:RHS repeat-associated protein
VRDPSLNFTSYSYDADDRLTEETDPLGTRSYGYDNVGNRVEAIDRNGRTRAFKFDDLNRIVEEKWIGDGKIFAYGYDAVGNLLSEDDGVTAHDYVYDALNRVTSDQTGALKYEYQYDKVNNLTKDTESIGFSKVITSYVYDSRNLLTNLERGDQSVIFGYRADGLRSKVDRFGIDKVNPTVTSDYSYDAYGRLTELKHSAGKIILSDNLYVLDDFDRLIKEVRDGQNRQIGYDSTNQITSVAGVSNEAYTYDQNGNRLANTTDTGNRLISDGVYDYVYDAEGNRIERKSIASGEITTYQWDYRNRLTGVQIGAKSIAYSYDSQDRRIAKFVDGALVERYGHDGTDLAVVFDAAGAVSNRYLYGGSIDEVLADQTPTTLNWALADRLGTVDLIVDDKGGVIDRVTFDSFGNKVSESAPEKSFRFGFTGRELDPETGLYYYRARYYDPLVGRFISVDSIGFQAGDTNLYRYVFNSPTLATDPTGHEWWDELGQNLGNAWNGAGNALQSAWNTTQDVAGRVADGAGYWAETFRPVTDDLSDKARGVIDFVARYSTVGVAVNAISTTANIVGSVANAIHKDWQDAGRDTENIGEQALFAADKVIAGFANVVSFGLTTKYREERYGNWIKKQHQGALYNTGQVAGVGASVALGFLTPGLTAVKGVAEVVTWGGRAAQGYTLLSAGVGSYNTTTKIVKGEVDWSNPLSYLEIAASYAPAIGFAAKVGGQKLLSTQIGQKSVTVASELLDNISNSRILDPIKKGIDNIATNRVIHGDIKLSESMAEAVKNTVMQSDDFINHLAGLRQGEDSLTKLSRQWLDNRGYQILYRGQSSGTTPILSPIARNQGISASHDLTQRMRAVGLVDDDIASMTARFHGEPVETGSIKYAFSSELDPNAQKIFSSLDKDNLVGERLGGVGIPTSNIPGIASSFGYGDSGVLFVLKLHKGTAIKPSNPQPVLLFEEEHIVLNQIIDNDIYKKMATSKVSPIRYDYGDGKIIKDYQK